MKNPFIPITVETQPKLKILIYGAENTGKSRAALTFPGVAIVDAENKSTLHAGTNGISTFSALPAQSLDDLDTAIAYIRKDAGKTYQTLVVDSITVLYLNELERVRMTSSKKILGYRERANVNRRMDNIYNQLAHLPVNLVIIAREATEYDENMNIIGIKPDSGGDLGYTFDCVVHMQKDYSGIVTRETGQLLTRGKRLVTVNWQAFEEALRERQSFWYDQPEKINIIIEKAKKYFEPLKDPDKIKLSLFDELSIEDWHELGNDWTEALNTIADTLKSLNSKSPLRSGGDLEGENTVGTGFALSSEGENPEPEKAKS